MYYLFSRNFITTSADAVFVAEAIGEPATCRRRQGGFFTTFDLKKGPLKSIE